MFRNSVLIVFVLACLVGCAPTEEASSSDAPVTTFKAGATPEETLEQFIGAQRAGDIEGARATLHPDSTRFNLDRAVVIQTYQILGKTVLSAAEAAEYTESPIRREGDVVLNVYEEYERGRTSSVTYFMREMHGVWRIYSLSFTL